MSKIISFETKDIGEALIDAKTPISFLVGFLAGRSNVNPSIATLIVLGYESILLMLEDLSVEKAIFSGTNESYGNKLVGVVAGMSGVYYGNKSAQTLNTPALPSLELSKPAAESEVAYAPQGGGIAGFFGCDVDEDDFQAMNRIRIYPGQTNNWIIGKRASSTDPVKETIEDMLDPINTSSWYNPGTWVKMPIAIAPSPSAEHVREEVAVEGLSVQKRRDDLTHVPNLGPNIVYYNVSFNAPKDAPPEIPWPVVGCVEEADWTVLWQLTSKAVAPIDTATPGSPTSQAAIEKAQQEAQQALLTGGSLPGMTDPMGGKQLDPKLIWVGAALAIGLVVLHRRQQEAQK